jgi:hypothetical protein
MPNQKMQSWEALSKRSQWEIDLQQETEYLLTQA